jgi:hypothetical protein
MNRIKNNIIKSVLTLDFLAVSHCSHCRPIDFVAAKGPIDAVDVVVAADWLPENLYVGGEEWHEHVVHQN